MNPLLEIRFHAIEKETKERKYLTRMFHILSTTENITDDMCIRMINRYLKGHPTLEEKSARVTMWQIVE